jgi:hypothetical protein
VEESGASTLHVNSIFQNRKNSCSLKIIFTIFIYIAHALGFGHEQSRDDRDTYVRIHWNNIIPGKLTSDKIHRNNLYQVRGTVTIIYTHAL